MVDWRAFRYNITDFLLEPFKRIGVPPNAISGFSLFLSIVVSLCFRSELLVYGIVALFAVLFLDALDGFLSREKNLESFDGLTVDVSCDRLSEFMIFYPSPLWLALAAVNCYVTVWRLRNERIPILPLRQSFLVIAVLGFFKLI